MCLKSITLKTGSVVPCGKCPRCIARRVSAWSFRLLHEDRVSESSHFITLTYDTKHIPIDLVSHKLMLQKRDLQLFFKRLRKAKSGNGLSDIKYYAVGEYGGHTRRPHYHSIIFNAEPELIDQAWNYGNVHYGSVTGASIGYCMKYMSKPKKGRDPEVPREFAVMSKGLGVSYIETMAEWHVSDLENRMYCTLPGGVKCSMPRYYKDKIYWDLERAAIAKVYSIQATDRLLEKILKQSIKDVRNEQAAIDAAYDRMYSSSLKTLL